MADTERKQSDDALDVPIYTARELDVARIEQLIKQRASFKVVAVENMSSVVNVLEGQIEKQKVSVRVYLEYRAATLAIGLSPVGAGWGQLVAAVAGVGIGIHNLATYNPDYEIAKNPLKSHVFVTYKKSVSEPVGG